MLAYPRDCEQSTAAMPYILPHQLPLHPINSNGSSTLPCAVNTDRNTLRNQYETVLRVSSEILKTPKSNRRFRGDPHPNLPVIWKTDINDIHILLLTQLLGRGGFGSVYRGDARDGKVYAVKCASRNMDEKQKKNNDDECSFECREAQLQQRISPHPNIAEVFGHAHYLDRVYTILEFANGGDLLDAIKQMSKTDRLRAWLDIANGLEHCHQNGIYHR